VLLEGESTQCDGVFKGLGTVVWAIDRRELGGGSSRVRGLRESPNGFSYRANGNDPKGGCPRRSEGGMQVGGAIRARPPLGSTLVWAWGMEKMQKPNGDALYVG